MRLHESPEGSDRRNISIHEPESQSPKWNRSRRLRCTSMSDFEMPPPTEPKSKPSTEVTIVRSHSFTKDDDPGSIHRETTLKRNNWMTWDDESSISNPPLSRNLTSKSLANSVVVSPLVVSKCVAIILHDMMTASYNNKSVGVEYQIFDQPKSPSVRKSRFRSPFSKPKISADGKLETITEFIHKICFQSQMEYECMVAAVLYIKQLVDTSDNQFWVTESNWKSVTLICMILANKMWDDFAMFNVDYCFIFPGLSVQRINDLELAYLNAVDYCIHVPRRSYVEMHFSIQDMITRGVIEQVNLEASTLTKESDMLNNCKQKGNSTLKAHRNASLDLGVHRNLPLGLGFDRLPNIHEASLSGASAYEFTEDKGSLPRSRVASSPHIPSVDGSNSNVCDCVDAIVHVEPQQGLGWEGPQCNRSQETSNMDSSAMESATWMDSSISESPPPPITKSILDRFSHRVEIVGEDSCVGCFPWMMKGKRIFPAFNFGAI